MQLLLPRLSQLSVCRKFLCICISFGLVLGCDPFIHSTYTLPGVLGQALQRKSQAPAPRVKALRGHAESVKELGELVTTTVGPYSGTSTELRGIKILPPPNLPFGTMISSWFLRNKRLRKNL